MRFNTLPEWLAWQETLHFTKVAPGLERIGKVYQQLIPEKPSFIVVTVAGTNGKGSSVALLQSILSAAGYQVGSYTSPHLLRYNERICINGIACEDDEICDVFSEIDQARGDTSLTYFEFGTLAAISIFNQRKLDIVIMEVGMGGRLDASNILDADIALISPISLDHTNWLGDTRDKIGIEKAGILRQDSPLVCSEEIPPDSVLQKAAEIGAPVSQAGKDFHYQANDNKTWQWENADTKWDKLPRPKLAGDYQLQNSAAVLQVISLLKQYKITASIEAIIQGLKQVRLSGRFQVFAGSVTRIFDVTHNTQGAKNLNKLLAETPCSGRTFAVLGMLKDKDASQVAAILDNRVDQWFVGGLSGERGQTGDEIAAKLATHIESDKITIQVQVEAAYEKAMAIANEGDRVLIFGSFHTVEAVMKFAGLADMKS